MSIESEIFKLIILPLLIFMARILDVTLGTVRIVFVYRGLKYLAPLVGFFEVLIWLLAIGQIMQNLTNVVCYIAYAAGFAMGNFVGIYVEKKLALGVSLIRVVTNKDASKLITFLSSKGFGITSIDAHGVKGRVHVIYLVIKRTDLLNVVNIIKKFNPKAFYTVEDVRLVSKGIFPVNRFHNLKTFHTPFRLLRKGK